MGNAGYARQIHEFPGIVEAANVKLTFCQLGSLMVESKGAEDVPFSIWSVSNLQRKEHSASRASKDLEVMTVLQTTHR